MSSQAPNPKQSRGPKPLVTRDLLLQAGRDVVAKQQETASSLTGLLSLTLSDLMARASQLVSAQQDVDKSLAPSVFYKHWPSLEAFAIDLAATLFDSSQFDLSALRSPVPLKTALADHIRLDLEQMSRHELGLYFGMFAASDATIINEALKRVYNDYDAAVIPVLRGAIERAGRAPRANLHPDGWSMIAAALTALTEGFSLRARVQPEVVGNETLWVSAGLAVVLGMTEPTGD